MLGFVRQVTGDVRQNKPAIKVRPTGEGGRQDVADALSGLIRNIEANSFASMVYAIGCDNATSCGQGAWRILTQYTDDDSFDQDIRLEAIPNALSVLWDPDAVKPDRSDAKWCFVYSTYSKEDYKAQWPEANAVSFDKMDSARDTYGDWYTDDGVRVAEYWVKKPVTKKLWQLDDGSVICPDEVPEGQLPLIMAGRQKVKERKVQTHKVCMYKISGAEVLEDETEWAGKYIPIIHVMGEETWVDERRVTYGLIHFAKDAQRAYNYARSTSIEVTALQPKAQWLLSTAMIEGYEAYWQNAGNSNYPYLPYNADPNMPNQTPRREIPPQPAAGLIAEAQLAADDMKGTTGIFDASLGAKSNETSGIAIAKRQAEGDVSTFVYIDNLAYAIAYTGRQLVELIPKIYDTRRVLRVLGDDGTDKEIVVNQMVMDGQGQQRVRHDPPAGFYDITMGKYDVVVEAGPSFTTRRQEAAAGMMELIRALPQAAGVIGDLLARTQDWPDAKEIGERLQGLQQPPQPNPKDLTQAEKNLADAEHTKAQTRQLNMQTGMGAMMPPEQGGMPGMEMGDDMGGMPQQGMPPDMGFQAPEMGGMGGGMMQPQPQESEVIIAAKIIAAALLKPKEVITDIQGNITGVA